MLTILTGPARCGKTERLLGQYRAALADAEPGTLLWLAPTWRAANEVRQRLFDGSFAGCFSPGVMTFETFAETVLRTAGVAMRPMTRLMKRELVRQIITEQSHRGRLTYFRTIAATAGLVDLVSEFISELKRLEIWPEEFQKACQDRGDSKDAELFEIYEAYQQALREHGLFDAEGRFWSARDVLQKGSGNKGTVPDQPAVGARRNGPEGAAHKWGPSPFFHLVIVDGFSDFTRTQHEILQILAERARAIIISLALEEGSHRADLFAKPLKTLAELRRRHRQPVMEAIARPAAADWPAMERLERRLFVNPRTAQAEGDIGREAPPSNIEILAAAREVGEMELIAGRIKRLLVDGEARPGEIAVVFRSPQDACGLAGEVFARFGIPVAFESGVPLDRAPCLRALAALLRLDVEDWPFDQLLSVIGGNYFQPDWPEWRHGRAAADVERTIRNLQVPDGRQRLIEQLQRAAEGGKSEDDAQSSSKRHAERACNATVEILQRLAAALDGLPERATLPEWAAAWQRLAQEIGLLRAIDRKPDGADTEESVSAPALDDRQAWNRLMDVLAAGDRLAAWLGQRPPELSRQAALDALLDVLAGESIGHAGDESGCVRVLSASSVRSLNIPYVFLAGLSEKVFPPPDRDNRLYSEAEYARMIEAGLPFVPRTERTREEMLLFYEAVTRATRQLYLSYPALDEAAQPLLPSPFLRDVEQAFAPQQVPRVQREDLSPVPSDDQPRCAAEFRVKALAMALAGDIGLLAGLLGTGESGEKGEGRREKVAIQRPLFRDIQGAEQTPRRSSAHRVTTSKSRSLFPLLPSPFSPLPANLIAGLATIYLRQDRERFGPAEGLLPGPEVAAYLTTCFPPEHVYPATQLESYASCPFRFFAERVLGIEPLEELALEFDPRNRGQAVHQVLATFHRRVNERFGRPASPLELEPADFDALLAATIDETLPAESDNTVAAAMREVDRRLIVEWLAGYREQLEKYHALWQGFDKPMVTELLEAPFGKGEDAAGPLEFVRGGEVVRFSGRIDRVDTGQVAGHVVFNIVDYKSGGTSLRLTPESIKAGITLQLPLYALAAVDLLLTDRDALPWAAGYWYVRESGFKPRQALRMYRNDDGRIELESAWEEIRDGLGDTVINLVNSLRQGCFPVCSANEQCTSYCPYSTICRINQVRSLEKTWQPANE